MDIVGLVKKSYADYGTMLWDSWYTMITEELHYTWTLTYCLVFGTLIIIGYWWRQSRKKRLEREALLLAQMETKRIFESPQRFRKRDRIMFYGRRIIRKVRSYSRPGKKRRPMMRFSKNLLESNEPPAEYLEVASDGNDRVPPDAMYMLQSIRIFGHFDTPVFLKLCKHTEVIDLMSGESLIKVGDPDDSMYIVQTGLVTVYLNNPDGSVITLKVVRPGEYVTSLLSFIDVLLGNTSQYKTITARATERSQVIRLPMSAFKQVFDEYPDLLVRVVQVIMVRLQRVTITALHNCLGLSTEHIQCSTQRKKIQLKTEIKPLSPGHRRVPSDQVQSHSLVELRPDMLADLSDSPPGARPSFVPSEPIEHTILKTAVVDRLLQELGLNESERAAIEKNVLIKEVAQGTILIKQGVLEEVVLIFVISGGLWLAQIPQKEMKEFDKMPDNIEAHSITIHPGDLVGGLAVLTGDSSLYTIKAKYNSRVALLNKEIVYGIMRRRPAVVLDIAKSVVKRLSPLVRQCDFALDWNFIESGRAVYRQAEDSDCTYIILNGRLRSVVTHESSKKEIIGEFGKGDLVGIIEMIAEKPRTTTVMAVRDSELAKLPEGLFNAIKIKYPVVVTQLIRLLSHRFLGSAQSRPLSTSSALNSLPFETNQQSQHRYSTVAVLPASDDVPLVAFVYELYHSLSAIGPTVRLNMDTVSAALGPKFADKSHEYRLTSWLSQQEDHHNITLLQCNNALDPWTQRCLRQADVILIVALGDGSPSIGKLEKEIDRLAIRTAKELVLLHSDSHEAHPTDTMSWLNMRSWVSRHHHIQCPNGMLSRRNPGKVFAYYSKQLSTEPYIHSDFSRLARWLTGNSVGIVLGGGGARGAAHVGMVKAILDAGIPIDMVGGVSIGAFMGALWCMEKNITTMTQKAREWCKKMANWGPQLLDLTYPITSMFKGRHFNQTIRSTFGDICIEDLWIPYFTLTTDISASCARVHTHGMLWRYARASMSVAGIFPPMVDNRDGHLLLDGCYTNNVPADVMRAQGATHIIAIDVGSQDDTDLTDYGDDLNGFWLLYKRWNPFTSPVKVPDLPDIQSRLAYVSCVRQLEEVKQSDYCEYIRPPIDKYKTLAFGSFDEIKNVGFEHGKECIEEMRKSGRLSRFNEWSVQSVPKKETHSLNEYSFVDLAQLVCKVPETHPERVYSSSEEDYYDGYASEPSSKPSVKKGMQANRPAGGSLSENEIDSDELEIPRPFIPFVGAHKTRTDQKQS
ncbi:neuropathy target esterase sws isoform X2 [Anopheles darlingi]|uniref:neuropathy target esterase sws isoform X2 n=1 Tax=Anopheles darlingi TaxID=43151 RepID=UPI0021003A53|nr:neuropathy target esterase sws isoform X2 [Anopheles darlingi]